MEGLGLWDVVKIAAGSGVVAAGINQGVQFWKDRNKQKGDAQYCAVQLISKLELFGVECSHNVEWHERRIQEAPHYQDMTDTCSMPDLTWSEDKLDVLQASVSSRMVWLSTEIRLANAKAYDNFDHDPDPEGFAWDRVSVVGYFGYKSLILADELRRMYNLPPLISDWSLDQKSRYLKRFWERAKTNLK
jgi:hypothetical protein